MVGYVDSAMCVVHADMTLTRSKVNWVMTAAPLWGILYKNNF